MRAAGVEALRAMADRQGHIDLASLLDPPALAAKGAAPEQRGWIGDLLLDLINGGDVVQAGDRLTLVESDIPDASMILASCAAEFPEAAADIALSALAADNLPPCCAAKRWPRPAPAFWRAMTAPR
jgi:hypothetical protein